MVSTRALLRYGLLGLPIAFAGLPLYVHLPHYYAVTYPISLGKLGAVMLATRMVDAVIDPMIGRFSDRHAHWRAQLMMGSLPVLALAYLALFLPPPVTSAWLPVWLFAVLVCVFASFSMLSINYYAHGAAMAKRETDHARVAACREAMILIGVLLASLLPEVLQRFMTVSTSFVVFSGIFAAMLFACGAVAIRPGDALPAPAMPGRIRDCLYDSRQRAVFVLFFLNTIPTALTSTLFLFFVQDVLHAGDASGALLALYFLTGALSIPAWARASARFGIRPALTAAMALAIVSFVWAYGLHAGQVIPFAVICACSGMAMGADVALLPAMLSAALTRTPHLRATAFGIWNFLSKLNVALAAGVALPLLAWAGYRPGHAADLNPLVALSFSYAMLPCMFKCAALAVLWRKPFQP